MKAKIVQKDNKILRMTAREVPFQEIKEKKIKNILKKMTEALAEKKEGVAIAASQIGEPLRIFIIDGNIWLLKESAFTPENQKLPKKPPVVFINPIIKKISKKKQIVFEGCLSVERVYGALRRPEKLTIEALDENGKKFVIGTAGLLAQIIQHEMDHLSGILFTDKAIKLEKVI
jgi:peptide deformylase